MEVLSWRNAWQKKTIGFCRDSLAHSYYPLTHKHTHSGPPFTNTEMHNYGLLFSPDDFPASLIIQSLLNMQWCCMRMWYGSRYSSVTKERRRREREVTAGHRCAVGKMQRWQNHQFVLSPSKSSSEKRQVKVTSYCEFITRLSRC